jgi:arsenical pump membrane protein
VLPDVPIPAASLCIWSIAALVAAGVVVRPRRWPEAVWALAGAAALTASGLIPWPAALAAVGEGGDVYLFLTGMMLLSETARREGVFDWAAARAVNAAKGSPRRLFALVFAAGVAVTVVLSNDATAVVLTPAVLAVTRRAGARPLPFLLACAFTANAASFVLPISNPANLVLYAGAEPRLLDWLARFLLPSALAVGATFGALAWAEREAMAGTCAPRAEPAPLTGGGALALAGIGATAAALLAVSALGGPLGAATALLGAATAGAVLLRRREGPGAVLGGVSWSVLPLVAGLFVVVEAVGRTGVTEALARLLTQASARSVPGAGAAAGTLVALAANLMNNLPAGLLAAATVHAAKPPAAVTDALLIGVDLGPNLAVTGSLATILWLQALRREGVEVSFLRFLKAGAVVAPPALALALAARLLVG